MENTTVDAFNNNRFVVVQPKKGGHRAGVDALLLASTVPDVFDGHLADLGAGSGAAALSVLSRCEAAQASLFEISETMVDYAKQTLANTKNKHLAKRAKVFEADVSADARTREMIGLEPNGFDWVIANPPFNDGSDRKSPHPDKALAHAMDGRTLENWTRTAASICKPSGHFSLIVRPQSIGEVLGAMMGRFGGLRITPVHPRAGEDAIRLLVVGKKGSKQKLEITPSLVLHGSEGGAFLDVAQALINGERSL